MKLTAACLLVLTMLTGCFAELDWREFRSTDGDFSVWFPARPLEQSRPLAGPAAAVMHQWTARARETLFAAGYADFNPLDRTALVQFSDALVANIGGTVQHRSDISLGSG